MGGAEAMTADLPVPAQAESTCDLLALWVALPRASLTCARAALLMVFARAVWAGQAETVAYRVAQSGS